MATSSDVILYRYSPDNMDEEVLRKLFVGREKFFESLVKEIKDAARKKTPRFYLILGPRGIGKSHLLVLLYYEIKNKLSSLIIPIKLAEEEYSVFRSSDLFLRILEVKGEETTDILDLDSEDEILHAAIEKLKQMSTREGKVYTIFIENIHEVFRQFDLEEMQKLRSIFQKNDIFSVVASAPMIFPAISDVSEPFFHFFTTKHLSEFSLSEIKELLMKIAEIENNKAFIKDFEKYEQKIHGMVHLTGGSPRLVILCYEMITKGELENIEKAFFKIIDEHTPYYQEIFQLLTGQKRRIFDILISSREPLTPKEIAEKARIDPDTVTTQLRRLEKDGYVISRREKKRSKYEVRERLFRLWREMRQPLGRKRVSVMLEFLELWYTPDERKELFETKFRLLDSGEKNLLRELCYYAEVQSPKFEVDTLIKLTPKLIEFGELKEAAYEIQKLKETASKTKDKELKVKVALMEGKLAIREKRSSDALAAFNKALKIDPKNISALAKKGIVLLNLGKNEDGLDTFNKALEIDPANEEILILKSNALYRLNRSQEAVTALKKALKINPKNPKILSRLGCLLVEEGKTKEAYEAIKTALKNKPEDENTLSMLGCALTKLDKPKDAIVPLKQAIKINPKDAHTHSKLSIALAELGKYNEALISIDNALDINPKYTNALNTKGKILFDLGKYEKALRVLDKILEIDSKNLPALFNKGMVLIKLNRHEDALKNFDKILDIEPENESALLSKGATLGNLKRYEEALSVFDKILEINPKNGLTLRDKVAVLISSDKFESALEEINRIKALDIEEQYKIDVIVQQIHALEVLNKKNEAILEIDKIKDKIDNQEPDLIKDFFYHSLSLALNEFKDGNTGSGDRLMKIAYDHSSKLTDKTLKELTIALLKDAAEYGKPNVIKSAVNIITKLKKEFEELLRPISNAIEIIETEDVNRYYDIQVEEREIVADIVKKITKSNKLLPDELKGKE